MPQRRLRFGKPNRNRKRSRLSKAGEILPTWYEMPRARARRCALKTTDRRPLVRTTARVTGAFSGTKTENGARAASIRKPYRHELRETRNSSDVGAVAAYGIRRRRPASSHGGRWSRSGRRGEAEARSGGAAASPGRTIGSRSGERGWGEGAAVLPVGDAAGGTEPGRRRSVRRAWRERDGCLFDDGGGCLPWFVGLRRGCFVGWSLRRAGVAHLSRRVLDKFTVIIYLAYIIRILNWCPFRNTIT